MVKSVMPDVIVSSPHVNGEAEAGGLRQVQAQPAPHSEDTIQRASAPFHRDAQPAKPQAPGAVSSAAHPALTAALRALLLRIHVQRGLPLPQLHLAGAAVETAKGQAVVAGLGLHPFPATCSPHRACPVPFPGRTRTTKIGPGEPPSRGCSSPSTAGNATGSG